jgi:hypothetical protein
MTKGTLAVAVALALTMPLATSFAQTSAPSKEQTAADQRKELAKNVQDTIARYKKTDPGIERFFKDSAGYAVLPRVGKAGFIVGGGQGTGEVYEKGKLVGTTSLSMHRSAYRLAHRNSARSSFSRTKAAFENFKQNKFEFAASASAVIMKSGVARDKNYKDGVALFVDPTGGAMAEAALGTQKFTFTPEGGAPAKK